METSTKVELSVTSAAVAVQMPQDAAVVFDYLKIEIVKSEDCCDEVVNELRRRCEKYNALGFDCEWVTENKGKRNPVTLIQLSSYDGYCGLFKLSAMKTVPSSLKALLEDDSVYKVGVAPADDSENLLHDYSVATKSTLDLRYLAEHCGHEPRGLASLAETFLGVVMDKSLEIRCSNWEADELTPRQATYAATDAHAAIRIFAILLQQLGSANTDEVCRQYADRKYNYRHKENNKSKTKETKVPKTDPNATRSKPLYNCFLEAPDGKLLPICDHKDPLWKVRSAARTLLYHHALPEAHRRQLEDFVLQHYPHHDDVTLDLLQEACNLQVTTKETKVSEDLVLSKQNWNLGKLVAQRLAACRSETLYNYILQAPDGELPCACDDKALWYIDKELADVALKGPLTFRLRIKPAGHSASKVGRYYQRKENDCVVCGNTDAYIKKFLKNQEIPIYLFREA